VQSLRTLLKRLLLALSALLFITAAEARPAHHIRHHATAAPASHCFLFFCSTSTPTTTPRKGVSRNASVSHDRPRDCYGIAWCGCWLRHHLGLNDVRLNLARAWAKVGTAAAPAVGVVVVWAHHVGIITGHDGNNWVVTSGNDGHAVRTRPRSLARAIAFRRV
jgi:hypothetical protein